MQALIIRRRAFKPDASHPGPQAGRAPGPLQPQVGAARLMGAAARLIAGQHATSPQPIRVTCWAPGPPRLVSQTSNTRAPRLRRPILQSARRNDAGPHHQAPGPHA